MKQSLLKDILFLKRAFLPKGLPIQLTFFVTSRCNAKCSHCFYSDQLNQPKERDLKLYEIERMAKNLPPRMLWVALGGGEPFLRSDLAEITKIFFRHNSPKVLSIPTNGLNPDRIEKITRKILSAKRDTFVNIAVSLDGLADTHDQERGVPGNFEKATETLFRLRSLKKEFKGFGFSTITTIHGRNTSELPQLEQFINDTIRPDSRSINLIRGTPCDPSLKKIDVLAGYKAAVDRKIKDTRNRKIPLRDWVFSRLNNAKDQLVYGEIIRVASQGTFRASCQAGSIGAVVYENGDVAACELLGRTVGNLREAEFDFSRLWYSEKAEKLRKDIKRHKCRCTWECAVSTNVLFNPRYWPSLAIELIRGRSKKEKQKRALVPVPKSLTILIPCRNEEKVIRRKIQNTLGLNYSYIESLQILVVDDYSDDASKQIILEEIDRVCGKEPAELITYLPNQYKKGKAGAIRTGLEYATGEVILMTDADVLIEKEGIVRAMRRFEEPKVGVIFGDLCLTRELREDVPWAPGDQLPGDGPIQDSPLRLQSFYDRLMNFFRKAESKLDTMFVVHGQMMFFRKELDLMPEPHLIGDDIYMTMQARKKGFRAVLAEGAMFWEEIPPGRKGFILQKRRRGRAIMQGLLHHKDLLFNFRYGFYGMVTIPFYWIFFFIQPIAVFTLLIGLVLFGFFSWSYWSFMILLLLFSSCYFRYPLSQLVLLNGIALSSLLTEFFQASSDRWERDRDIY